MLSMGKTTLNIYTIEQALTELKKYDPVFTDKNDIYRLAIAGKIKISFQLELFNHIGLVSQGFVRMDESGHELTDSYCKELGETFLVPKDRNKHGLEFLQVNTLNNEEIYPYVSPSSLGKMIIKKYDMLFIPSYNMDADYKGENIKITPCTLRKCPKENEKDYQGFIDWLIFPSLESSQNSDTTSPSEGFYSRYFKAGYLFKMANRSHHPYRVNESQLRITKQEVENYIQRLILDQINLDEDYYSLKDAKIRIKEIAGVTRKKHNLIKLAESGEIRLSIRKKDWKYVRIDEQGQEMEIMPCKVFGKGTIHLIVPRSGLFINQRFDKKGLDSGTGTENYSLLYGDTTDKTIYPFFNPMHLKSRTNDKKLYIHTHDMEAEYKSQSIKVSKVNYESFPEKGDSNYLEFIEWLESNITWKSITKDEDGLLDPRMHFDSNFFYKLGGLHKGRGVEIKEKDLVLTREELGNYILSIMDAPSPYSPLQETVIYQPVSDNTTRTNKNEIFSKFFDTSGLTNGQFFYESRLTNGRLKDDELRKQSANEYLKELILFCKSNDFSFEYGLTQLRDHLRSEDPTNKSFETLFETVKSRLNDYAQHPTPNEPQQASEPLNQVKPKKKTTTQKNNLVDYNGKKVKPATKEKYQGWQQAVNKKQNANNYLSHSAICTSIAGSLKISPETIRKNTKLLSN